MQDCVSTKMIRRTSPILWFICGICLGLIPYLNEFWKETIIGVQRENMMCVSRRDYNVIQEANRAWDQPWLRQRRTDNDGPRADKSNQGSNTKLYPGNKNKQRKFLLDCGANIASTIRLFRETYPEADDFEIHSFEIDDRLAPYFAPYKGVNMHCPLGVSNETGFMTAYSEAPWSPNKGLNNGKDMQWGGGTLFVSDKEKKDDKTGGSRHLSHRKQIPVVDLSQWIQTHTSRDDYVIFKLDVEGAEYDILDKMLRDGTFKWIDKMYGEYHYSQPHGWNKTGRDRIMADVKKQGFEEVDWAGEYRDYGDFEKMHPVNVPKDMPGEAGKVYSECQPKHHLALSIAVGMNYKRAQRLIDTIAAYPVKVPITLFFYGDFVQQHPDAVLNWSRRFELGLREDAHYPAGYFEIMAHNWIRAALVSSEMKFRNIGIQPAFYLPTAISKEVTVNAKSRGFRIVTPAAVFPPPLDYPVKSFDRVAYYKHRDVERIPKALRVIHQQLEEKKGGMLVLDSDLPDSLMNIVFLLDYLVRASEYTLVDMNSCVY